ISLEHHAAIAGTVEVGSVHHGQEAFSRTARGLLLNQLIIPPNSLIGTAIEIAPDGVAPVLVLPHRIIGAATKAVAILDDLHLQLLIARLTLPYTCNHLGIQFVANGNA